MTTKPIFKVGELVKTTAIDGTLTEGIIVENPRIDIFLICLTKTGNIVARTLPELLGKNVNNKEELLEALKEAENVK